MAYKKKNNRNFMEEMRRIIDEMDNLKTSPGLREESCPPFGCPEEHASYISTCQIPSTSSRVLQTKSLLSPNSQSLAQICHPAVHNFDNFKVQDRQQYSKSSSLNYLPQPHQNQNFAPQAFEENSCPQSSSYIVSIPFS